jgi:hypothetical protein
MQIEVLRPNRQHAEGTLQHHNLHYNVALVCVEDFCSREPAIIQDRWYDNCKLLAVGCCFRSGTVMASTGYQFVGPCVFDCEYLAYTKCRITKVHVFSFSLPAFFTWLMNRNSCCRISVFTASICLLIGIDDDFTYCHPGRY